MSKKADEFALDLLDDVFAELAETQDAGIAFLPRHASLRMAEAGARAAGISVEQALRVYEAMVAAEDLDESFGLSAPQGQTLN